MIEERTHPDAALVDALALDGDLVDALRARHVPDDDGRCRGCSAPGSSNGRGERWPCLIRTLADDAEKRVRWR